MGGVLQAVCSMGKMQNLDDIHHGKLVGPIPVRWSIVGL